MVLCVYVCCNAVWLGVVFVRAHHQPVCVSLRTEHNHVCHIDSTGAVSVRRDRYERRHTAGMFVLCSAEAELHLSLSLSLLGRSRTPCLR